VAFLGNLSLLMTAGEIRGDTFLQALSNFGRDPEPQVVSSALDELEAVRPALVPDSLAGLFAGYVRRTLSPALERIGTERSRARTRRCPRCAGSCCAGSRAAARTRR